MQNFFSIWVLVHLQILVGHLLCNSTKLLIKRKSYQNMNKKMSRVQKKHIGMLDEFLSSSRSSSISFQFLDYVVSHSGGICKIRFHNMIYFPFYNQKFGLSLEYRKKYQIG